MTATEFFPPEAGAAALTGPLPERLVVIGDLNGHLRLLERLMLGTGLVDDEGAWVGGQAVLIQMGDVVNRGSTSRAAMDRLLNLQTQARRAGGDVIWLLGNHEVMTALGHEAYVSADEYLEFASPDEVARFVDDRTRYVYELLGPPSVAQRVDPIAGLVQAWEESHAPGKEAFRAAFAVDGSYGEVIRRLPIAVRRGPLLFVHGGLGPIWAELGLDGLDMMTREAWARMPAGYQELEANGIFRDPLGPLWHRAFCMSDAPTVCEDALTALDTLDAARMVVGHTRTETVDGTTGVPLLRQGGRVLMTDVGMGEPGEPGSALVIENGQIDVWSPVDGRYALTAIVP